MKKQLFPLIIAGALLWPVGCTSPQAARQSPPKPLFGPGSERQPAYASGTAPAYPRGSSAAQQPSPPPSLPPQNWQNDAATHAAPPVGAAAWQIIGAPHSQSLGHGAALHECKARSISGAAEVVVVVFDSRQCGLKVIDQPMPNAGGRVLDQLMRSHRAIAGVNGGFFHPDFQPLGIFIADGRKNGFFTSNKLLSGSVLVIGREPYLIWNSEFLGDAGVTDLIQSGPRLVDNGMPIQSLNGTKQASRTFIATDGKRMWAVGVVRSTSLAGLADLLANSNVIPGLRVARALNLDGGHSSAFWARPTSGREISQPGWSTVRNYLAIIPK
jgi:uncharacterized protein YigE (DUF2233 family)